MALLIAGMLGAFAVGFVLSAIFAVSGSAANLTRP